MPCPLLFPNTIEYANAAAPLATCTGVPPAKSNPPILFDHPRGFHVQHAIGSYTSVAHTNINTTHGSIRPLSATAPAANATVTHANMPWYTANKRSGMRDEAMEGAARTLLKPKLERSPM